MCGRTDPGGTRRRAWRACAGVAAAGTVPVWSAQPDDGQEVAGPYEVIHLGGQAAVVVPMADYMRLRALERLASGEELEDAEDTAALEDWKAREAAGQTSYVPASEVRQRLGLAQ
jgi:hypothetical protein